ncbi:MAG TPA: C45 family peptidase [Nannocystaceae bacterium]|nr:C45 family peptidase [Nannocystaceae bacterium]
MGERLELVTFDQANGSARGRAHGELWRAEIRELTDIRVELCIKKGGFRDRAQLLAIAELHLPPLLAHDTALHAELIGIAEGAALTPAEIVVLNHYSDLRDVPASVLDDEGCTAIYVPGSEGALLGQTWDMHATAEPFVRAVRFGDDAICFTLTGCLGMAGLGKHGVAVTINNLSSTDGKVGVVWPAIVRAMLACTDARAAYELLLRTPLSSGHHYMIADGHEFYGVECSGELKVLTQKGAKAAHLHTNHCFDPVLRTRERVPAGTTSWARLDSASTLYVQQRPRDVDGLWTLLGNHDGYPRSICSHKHELDGDPSASKTCGRLVIEPGTGRMRVAVGCSRDDAPIDLLLSSRAGERA